MSNLIYFCREIAKLSAINNKWKVKLWKKSWKNSSRFASADEKNLKHARDSTKERMKLAPLEEIVCLSLNFPKFLQCNFHQKKALHISFFCSFRLPLHETIYYYTNEYRKIFQSVHIYAKPCKTKLEKALKSTDGFFFLEAEKSSPERTHSNRRGGKLSAGGRGERKVYFGTERLSSKKHRCWEKLPILCDFVRENFPKNLCVLFSLKPV